MSEFKINIEGNFLDSFIYSGVLFTVDVNGVLCTYSWNNLIKEYIKKDYSKKKFEKKLIDTREKTRFEEDFVIELDQKFLEKYQQGICVDLDVWSTDLDIKDNILYISSERGLEALPFGQSWNKGKVMKFNDLYKVWGESKVFGVSTGSWGRTLLAAGCNGALEVINSVEQVNNIDLKQQDGKVINSEVCLDCEWELNSTIAILDQLNTQAVLEYKRLMGDKDFKSNSSDSRKKIEEKLKNRESIPQEKISDLKQYIQNGIPNSLVNEAAYSWFDGNKLVGLDDKNNALFYDFSQNEWIKKEKKMIDEQCYRKIRQTNVGIIVETENDSLYRKIGDNSKLLSEDISSWRVFPRSTNYQDRIHIVNEDYLQVSIFD